MDLIRYIAVAGLVALALVLTLISLFLVDVWRDLDYDEDINPWVSGSLIGALLIAAAFCFFGVARLV
ncbi:MAG: hypothetical protein J0H63_11225 [Rhizobiales bacterium]|nr:hypothetical protein [Hyphomicrobiales bacterium]MBN9010667.1 hypothetical protein [Hyphomicrobiales bacterium]